MWLLRVEPIALKVVVFVLLLSATLVSGEESTERMVRSLLQGYEWKLDRKRFEVLPADAYKILIAISKTASEVSFVRARATAALRLFPNEEVFDYYSEQIRTNDSLILRRRVVEAMCEAFVNRRPVDLEVALSGMLEVKDPHLRTKVARCLGQIDSTSARRLLDLYSQSITDSWERKAAGLAGVKR